MEDWHPRYQQQAGWSAPLREYLFTKYNLATENRFLDVGCGTGALLPELALRASSGRIFGLDFSLPALRQAGRNTQEARLLCADAHQLPFSVGSFDVSLCHFLLLWVKNPLEVLREMRRVTRPGGFVLALAEPDYAQRHDAPADLAALGDLQTQALRDQGADVGLGAKLAQLLQQAGLQVLESGQFQQADEHDWDLEWQTLAADAQGYLSEESLRAYYEKHLAAVENQSRRLRVPTYFACGRVNL